jgi:hypothetical protein
LSPSFGLEESRTTPFQEGEDGEDIPALRNPDALVTPDASVTLVASSVTAAPPQATPSSAPVTQQDTSAPPVTQHQASVTPSDIYEGPVTRSCAKKLQQEVHAFLSELNFNTDENIILPKSCILLLLRFTQEGFPLGYTKETEGYTRASRQLHMLRILIQVCTISGRDRIHALHGWKHHQVKIPTQQTARHFDFPIRSNGHLIEGCTGTQKTLVN